MTGDNSGIATRVDRASKPRNQRRDSEPENKTAVASQAIGATIEAGLIKLDERVGSSRKYARYLPFWA